MKLLSKLIFFLSLLSLVSCTITKRKYTGGFYVNWHNKAVEVLRPQRTHEAVPVRTVHPGGLHGQENPDLPINKISTTYKDINLRNATSRVHIATKISASCNDVNQQTATLQIHAIGSEGMPPRTDAARFRNNGLFGFELALLDLIVLGLLIFFGHIGYTVFVLGCLLLIIGLTIAGLIYSFMGLNANDKHRVLGLLGVLLCIFVVIGVIYFGG